MHSHTHIWIHSFKYLRAHIASPLCQIHPQKDMSSIHARCINRFISCENYIKNTFPQITSDTFKYLDMNHLQWRAVTIIKRFSVPALPLRFWKAPALVQWYIRSSRQNRGRWVVKSAARSFTCLDFRPRESGRGVRGEREVPHKINRAFISDPLARLQKKRKKVLRQEHQVSFTFCCQKSLNTF